jgi:hypothetical protein
MATRALHALPRPNSRWGDRPHSIAGKRLTAVGAAFRRSASVALHHVQEHGYFLAAAGCADAAGFVHSTFTGLIVSAGAFLAIEWRVSR